MMKYLRRANKLPSFFRAVLLVAALGLVGCATPGTQATERAPQKTSTEQTAAPVQKNDRSATPGQEVSLLFSSREIPEGASLSEEYIAFKKVPERDLPRNPIFEAEASDFIGAQVAHRIDADTMILSSDFKAVATASSSPDCDPSGKGGAAASREIPQGDKVEVVFATESIPKGAYLTGENTEFVRLPRHLLLREMLFKGDLKRFQNTPLKHPVGSGAALTIGDFPAATTTDAAPGCP